MSYTKFHEAWADLPARTTPVTAEALDHIEAGIGTASAAADSAGAAVDALTDVVESSGETGGERWVSVDGDDANDGKSPGKPTATIAAAVVSLGLDEPWDAGGGTVHIGPGVFDEDVVIHGHVLYDGAGEDVTFVKSPLGSTSPGCFTIDPTYPCVYARVENLTIMGCVDDVDRVPINAGQHGLYIQGTTEGVPGSGMWFGRFSHVKVFGFAGHQIWLRGGDDSFQCPNQFLTFNDCRADANLTHSSLMMSGQNGQMEFNNCSFDGQGKGDGTRNIAMTRHCSDDFGAVVTSSTTAYSITFNDLTTQLNSLAIYGNNTYAGIVFNNLHVEECTDGANAEASAGFIFNSPVFGNTGDHASGYAVRAGSGTHNIINQGVPGNAETSWLAEGGGYNQVNDPPVWGGNYSGAGQTIQVGTSATFPTYMFRTFLVNGDAGATPIDTIQSPYAPGESIYLHANGGDGFDLDEGGNISLGGEVAPFRVREGVVATLTKFDVGGDWILTGVSGGYPVSHSLQFTPLVSTIHDTGVYRTFLVNGDAGANPIYAITSDHPVGTLIHFRADTTGGGFALGDGFGIELGSAAPLLAVPAKSCATLVRLDLPNIWQLVSMV